MAVEQWSGNFCTPMTPFDENDQIDMDALYAECQFIVESGATGMCVPVMVSEFRWLSEKERRTLIEVPVKVSDGKLTIVANVAATNAPLAVEYAKYAQGVGADAVIAMPPYISRTDFGTVFNYFKAISDAVDIPVWIQNAGMLSLSADQNVKLCEEIENVSWVKEEVPPSTHNISALLAKKSPAVHGVMGGGGGRFMVHEFNRGSKGLITACEYSDVLQHIWNLMEAGNMAEAEDVFDVLLPGIVLEGLMGMGYAKHIMCKRGVLKNYRVRNSSKPLDEDDMREIDRVYERLEPVLRWKK